MYTILITGSRTWTDYEIIRENLEVLRDSPADGMEITVRHGDANGADRLAGKAARELGFHEEKFPASWGVYGKSAGYKRNALMCTTEPKPDICLAFQVNNSRGAQHCIDLARAEGIEVIVV